MLLRIVLIPLVSVSLAFVHDFVPAKPKIKLRQLNFDPTQLCTYKHVTMVTLVNNNLQYICYFANR